MRRALLVTALLALGVAPTVARAEDDITRVARAPLGDDDSSSPFRGSSLTYRNAASTLSFDRSAELTYNPIWTMGLEIAPRFWFNDTFSVSASLSLDREITEADDTTFANETLLSDLVLGASARKWATIPVVDIDVSGGVQVILPTSKASQGDTLLFAVAPQLRLAHTFPVLSGFTLAYSLRVAKYFHRYTTGELDSPLISGCFGSPSCDRLVNTGVRNTSFRVTNAFSLSLAFTDWLSFDAQFGVITSFLYSGVDDDRVSLETLEPTSTRHALLYDLGATAQATDFFAVTLGVSTLNPQLAPDSTRYAPFFNRYTAVYLDLRVDVAQLVVDVLKD